MKILKTLFASTLMLCVFQLHAQSNRNGVMNASKKTTFNIEMDGKKNAVELMVYENRNYEMKFDQADKGKVDQDRTSALAKVTKLIQLKSNIDAINDRFILLKYDRQVTDTFEVSPIPNGFLVTVDKKEIKYVFHEGKYTVNTDDNDFFIVEEFGF